MICLGPLVLEEWKCWKSDGGRTALRSRANVIQMCDIAQRLISQPELRRRRRHGWKTAFQRTRRDICF